MDRELEHSEAPIDLLVWLAASARLACTADKPHAARLRLSIQTDGSANLSSANCHPFAARMPLCCPLWYSPTEAIIFSRLTDIR